MMLLVSRGFLTGHKLLFQKMTAAILLAIPSTFLLITLMMIANKAFRYRSSASPIHPVSAPALIFHGQKCPGRMPNQQRSHYRFTHKAGLTASPSLLTRQPPGEIAPSVQTTVASFRQYPGDRSHQKQQLLPSIKKLRDCQTSFSLA